MGVSRINHPAMGDPPMTMESPISIVWLVQGMTPRHISPENEVTIGGTQDKNHVPLLSD